jgi:hypothetical protein
VRSDPQEMALLRILIATGEKALEAFEATDNPVDRELVADLRRVIERSRGELDALTARQPASS